MAVSTNCRKCSEHFNIVNGEAVSSKLLNASSFSPIKTLDPKKQEDETPNEQNAPTIQKKEKEKTKKKEPTAKTAKPSQPEKAPSKTEEKPTLPTYLQEASQKNPLKSPPKGKTREIECFDCHATHHASIASTSTLCPKCGSYIGLKDFEIKEKWNRQIKTRGNVVVHKKGSILGSTTQCHDLTIHGDFTGGVDCSGNLTITRHGKMMGHVRCKKLSISKRAEVEFTNGLYCEEVHIDGKCTGEIICSGKIELAKKATLIGDIAIGSLSFSEGARHSGAVRTYDPETDKLEHEPRN